MTGTPSATATATSTGTPGPSQLEISKTSASSVVPGGTLVYRIDFANVGSGPATDVVVTEAVPDHTGFNSGAGSPGWSCSDASPPGTICTHAVPDLSPNAHGVLYFAVTVDNPIGATAIRNSVQIRDAEGGSADGSETAFVAAEAPALAAWGLAGALALLAAIAGLRLRRSH